MKKDTVYVDIDDEITTIIDKVRSSEQKIVALVLPKRAAVLQSIVNMRLLKRTADSAHKKIVLITTENGILPLAGMVGLHVARNLQSKPEVPAPPSANQDSELDITEPAEEPPLDPNKSVGELAGLTPAAAAAAPPPDDANAPETIEIDAQKDQAAAAAALAAGKPAKVPKKDGKLKVPNFDKFRLRLFLAALALILLIGGYIFGFVVLPKANVSVQAEITNIPFERDVLITPTSKDFVLDKGVLPAENKELKKQEAEKFQATGEEDKGNKATGKVTLYNCNKDDTLAGRSITIPNGTGVSSGEYTFIMQSDATIEPSNFDGDECRQNKSTEVPVVAQNAGDKYNLSSRGYNVAGFSSVIAKGQAMSGGTTKVVKVVSQSDFDSAKQKLSTRNTDDVKKQLTDQLQQSGLKALHDTFVAVPGPAASVPKVNDEATGEATMTMEFTYSMLGVKEDQLKQLIEAGLKDKFDKDKQKVYKDGLEKMKLTIGTRAKNGDLPAKLQTTVSTGPQLEEEEIKKEVAGRKRGDAEQLLESRPGIKEATIDYDPFWVVKAPKKLHRITVTFDVPETGDTQSGDQQ